MFVRVHRRQPDFWVSIKAETLASGLRHWHTRNAHPKLQSAEPRLIPSLCTGCWQHGPSSHYVAPWVVGHRQRHQLMTHTHAHPRTLLGGGGGGATGTFDNLQLPLNFGGPWVGKWQMGGPKPLQRKYAPLRRSTSVTLHNSHQPHQTGHNPTKKTPSHDCTSTPIHNPVQSPAVPTKYIPWTGACRTFADALFGQQGTCNRSEEENTTCNRRDTTTTTLNAASYLVYATCAPDRQGGTEPLDRGGRCINNPQKPAPMQHLVRGCSSPLTHMQWPPRHVRHKPSRSNGVRPRTGGNRRYCQHHDGSMLGDCQYAARRHRQASTMHRPLQTCESHSEACAWGVPIFSAGSRFPDGRLRRWQETFAFPCDHRRHVPSSCQFLVWQSLPENLWFVGCRSLPSVVCNSWNLKHALNPPPPPQLEKTPQTQWERSGAKQLPSHGTQS